MNKSTFTNSDTLQPFEAFTDGSTSNGWNNVYIPRDTLAQVFDGCTFEFLKDAAGNPSSVIISDNTWMDEVPSSPVWDGSTFIECYYFDNYQFIMYEPNQS